MTHSVYIHIPFCDSICSYCDFCKMYYNSKLVDDYLQALEKEIKDRYQGEIIKTIYIGGGTPSSLSIDMLNKLFKILSVFNTNDLEYTIECNIENITEDKIKIFKENGVNRISIGLQTLNQKYLKFLNRHHNKEIVLSKINMIKKYFSNINIDLIYAIPNQTIDELNEDLDFVLNLDVTHISTYSLIIEEHTKLYIDGMSNIDEELDLKMYQYICNKLNNMEFKHYEISNFSKNGFESKHNLTYWNNEHYYGFGLGASGYINDTRYDNTRSINQYLRGKYVLNQHYLDDSETMENEFILGLRKLKGINKKLFYQKYNVNINSLDSVKNLLKSNKLLDDGKYIFINPKYLYISNEILIDFIN